jgi:peptide/nickel transport system substrate-binding protein
VPKTLRIAFQGFEEPNRDGIMGYGSAAGFDPLEHFLLFHAPLTVYDQQGNLVPRLAEKLPSLQDGDLKTFPDGHMEVTWKLRSGATWHDGTPLQAEDFALGFQVLSDGEVPASRPGWARLVAEVQTPDPRTLVVLWREPSFLAGGNGASDIPPMPAHLLADLYRSGDRQTFINSPYWTTEFVGLGPYKLAQWQRGAFIEGAAFDGFVLGRPKIDRIILSYVGDVNAIVAGVLSSDIEMVPMGARLDASQLVAIQDGWGTSGGSTLLVPFGIRTIWLQFKEPAAPWVRDVRVRRALAHSTDRQGMSDALQYGLTPPADTFVSLEDGAYRALQNKGFARYPFDPARARALFADAGWSAGAEGLLRDTSARALMMEVGATAQGGNVQEIETVSAQWRAAGVDAHPAPIPPQAANIDERKATVQGGFMWPWTPNLDSPQNLTAAQIPTERTSWKGRNYTGYSNPVYEDLYHRFTGTLDVAERQSVVADMMTLVADEVPVIPVYYYGNGVIARKGLDGPGMISPLQTASTWNINTWQLG